MCRRVCVCVCVSVCVCINVRVFVSVCVCVHAHMHMCADGADHSLCCEREGVPHTCLPLCQGQAGDPNSPDLPQCVDVEEPILNCMETGYGRSGPCLSSIFLLTGSGGGGGGGGDPNLRKQVHVLPWNHLHDGLVVIHAKILLVQ